MGERQKGRNDLKLASLRRDREWVVTARDVAMQILDADPDLSSRKVHQAYDACHQAVQERLAREKQGEDAPPSRFANPTRNEPPDRGGSTKDRPDSQRRHAGTATQNQLRAIFSLARRQRIDPQQLANERFGVDRIEELSIREASALIDELKRSAPAMRA